MIKALAITGPTASGKTALSLEIAERLDCEIVCLDSMQIYRGMDIGTAKATAAEQARVRHHMTDIVNPDESFSAGAYKREALCVCRDIEARGKTPLFVGGTGLYLSTLMRPDCEEPPPSSAEYRQRIEEGILTEEDRIALHERLMEIDPESAELIHYNNVRRVIRALEIFDATGKTKTYFDMLTRQASTEIEVCHVTLDFHDRELLYRRVDERVDVMIAEGLFDEVLRLLSEGYLTEDSTAAQAIGYKEMLGAVRGEMPLDVAIEQIKQATRNYAKRQLTWFRHNGNATSVFADDGCGRMRRSGDIVCEMLGIFKGFLGGSNS